MADDVDLATAINDRALEAALAARRGDLTHGEPGECRDCEHWSPRLVRGRCAFCRDGRPRP